MRDVLFVLALLIASGIAYVMLDRVFEDFDEEDNEDWID